MKKIYLMILAVAVINTTKAQDSTNAKELGELIVTGQYKPQSVKNSVYQVKVISKERIQKQGAVRLQDVLNNELNIRFAQDLATGGANITMMGLPGQNVKILIDGVPFIGRQGTTNEVNINQIDVNTIERIEIVEGPMSVIYGADALAGVINIITKKAGASKISVTARVQEETVGKEYGKYQGIHNQYAGLAFRHKRWEIGGGIGYNYFGGWKGDSTYNELAWHWKDQITGNAFIGYNTGKFNIRYRFDGLDEIITNPGFYTWEKNARDSVSFDQDYLTQRQMHQVQAGYTVNTKLSFQGQSAYTDYSRQVFSYLSYQSTGKISQDPNASQGVDEFKGFTFRGTAQYRISPTVYFQPGVDINLESGKGERLKTGSNEISDYAFFITSEITPWKQVNIRPGLRFIHNSVYDAPLAVPSINTKFAISDHLDFRFAYARGFRAPSLRELYFNFIDGNHEIIGNPDLKAETSHSLTGSFAWRKVNSNRVAFGAAISGFYNSVKDLIGYAFDQANPNLATLVNISNSKTAGVSLAGTVNYKNLALSLGASYTGFYNDDSEVDKTLPDLQWSPEINSIISYSLPKIGLDFNLFYKFTGRKPNYVVDAQGDIVLSKLDSYSWADFTVNKKLFKMFTLNAGIRNLFDVTQLGSTRAIAGGGHTSSEGSSQLAYGRSYFAGLLFNWEK